MKNTKAVRGWDRCQAFLQRLGWRCTAEDDLFRLYNASGDEEYLTSSLGELLTYLDAAAKWVPLKGEHVNAMHQLVQDLAEQECYAAKKTGTCIPGDLCFPCRALKTVSKSGGFN